jgi:hypothetical protein
LSPEQRTRAALQTLLSCPRAFEKLGDNNWWRRVGGGTGVRPWIDGMRAFIGARSLAITGGAEMSHVLQFTGGGEEYEITDDSSSKRAWRDAPTRDGKRATALRMFTINGRKRKTSSLPTSNAFDGPVNLTVSAPRRRRAPLPHEPSQPGQRCQYHRNKRARCPPECPSRVPLPSAGAAHSKPSAPTAADVDGNADDGAVATANAADARRNAAPMADAVLIGEQTDQFDDEDDDDGDEGDDDGDERDDYEHDELYSDSAPSVAAAATTTTPSVM